MTIVTGSEYSPSLVLYCCPRVHDVPFLAQQRSFIFKHIPSSYFCIQAVSRLAHVCFRTGPLNTCCLKRCYIEIIEGTIIIRNENDKLLTVASSKEAMNIPTVSTIILDSWLGPRPSSVCFQKEQS